MSIVPVDSIPPSRSGKLTKRDADYLRMRRDLVHQADEHLARMREVLSDDIRHFSRWYTDQGIAEALGWSRAYIQRIRSEK